MAADRDKMNERLGSGGKKQDHFYPSNLVVGRTEGTPAEDLRACVCVHEIIYIAQHSVIQLRDLKEHFSKEVKGFFFLMDHQNW